MKKKQKTIYINSLGCPRNQVDSEIFNSIAAEHGYLFTEDVNSADILLINTCSFITDAKEESINSILYQAVNRKEGSVLIVTGCLNKRYPDQLKEELPEVDYFVDLKDYPGFSELLSSLSKKTPHSPLPENYSQRKLLNSEPHAYLKISDGCENHCSYCAIPSIRGKLVSDPIDKLVTEAKWLAEQGKKELILTAMDISQYGKELSSGVNLIRLLEKLVAIDKLEWIRLLYLHPKGITKDLIKFIKNNEKICPYLDIPLQHINDKILKSMNRGVTRYEIEKLLDYIRSQIRDITIRTTFILGYPGETNKEFMELYDFVKNKKFNHLGTFIYSPEEGTPAYTLPKAVTTRTACNRQERLMELQEFISAKLLTKYIGKRLPVIIETVEDCDDEVFMTARTRYDSPEIDGSVFFSIPYPCSHFDKFPISVGDIVEAEITESSEYDLGADLIKPEININPQLIK